MLAIKQNTTKYETISPPDKMGNGQQLNLNTQDDKDLKLLFNGQFDLAISELFNGNYNDKDYKGMVRTYRALDSSSNIFFKNLFKGRPFFKRKTIEPKSDELNLLGKLILIRTQQKNGILPQTLEKWIKNFFLLSDWHYEKQALNGTTCEYAEKVNGIIFFFKSLELKKVSELAATLVLTPATPADYALLFLRDYYHSLSLFLLGDIKTANQVVQNMESRQNLSSFDQPYLIKGEKYITLKMALLGWTGKFGEAQLLWEQQERNFSQKITTLHDGNKCLSHLLAYSLAISPHLPVFDLWISLYKPGKSGTIAAENQLFLLFEILLKAQHLWDSLSKSPDEIKAISIVLQKCLRKNRPHLLGSYFVGFNFLLDSLSSYLLGNKEDLNFHLMLAENYAGTHDNYFLMYWVFEVKMRLANKTEQISEFQKRIFATICTQMGCDQMGYQNNVWNRNDNNEALKFVSRPESDQFHSLINRIFQEDDAKNKDPQWLLRAALDEVILSTGAELAILLVSNDNKELSPMLHRRRDREPVFQANYPLSLVEKMSESRQIYLENDWCSIPLMVSDRIVATFVLKMLPKMANSVAYDITKRDFGPYALLIMGLQYKRNKRELEENYLNLQFQNQQLINQLQQLPILMLSIDKKGEIVYQNGKIVELMKTLSKPHTDVQLAFKAFPELLKNINMCIKGVSFHKTVYEGEFVFDGHFINNDSLGNEPEPVNILLVDITYKSKKETLLLHQKISEGIERSRLELLSEFTPGLLQIVDQIHSSQKELQSTQRDTKLSFYKKAVIWLQNYYNQNSKILDNNFSKILLLLEQIGREKELQQEKLFSLTDETDNKLRLLAGMLKNESKKIKDGSLMQEVNLRNEVESNLDLLKPEFLNAEIQIVKAFGSEVDKETVTFAPQKFQYIVSSLIKVLIENARGNVKNQRIIKVEAGFQGFKEIYLSFSGYGNVLSNEQISAIFSSQLIETEDTFVNVLAKCNELVREIDARFKIESLPGDIQKGQSSSQKMSIFFKVVF